MCKQIVLFCFQKYDTIEINFKCSFYDKTASFFPPFVMLLKFGSKVLYTVSIPPGTHFSFQTSIGICSMYRDFAHQQDNGRNCQPILLLLIRIFSPHPSHVEMCTSLWFCLQHVHEMFLDISSEFHFQTANLFL